MSDEVKYSHELMDFPDAQELRDITTPKEELFLAKKRSFIMSLGEDMVSRAKNKGEMKFSVPISDNVYGLDPEGRTRLMAETMDFLSKNGFVVTFDQVNLTIDWTSNV